MASASASTPRRRCSSASTSPPAPAKACTITSSSRPSIEMPVRKTLTILTCALGLFAAATAGRGATARFYPDDPIAHDPETESAAGARPVEVSGQFDLIENSFLGAGDEADLHAVNVNTIDEVPDSSWFTNRLGGAGRSG